MTERLTDATHQGLVRGMVSRIPLEVRECLKGVYAERDTSAAEADEARAESFVHGKRKRHRLQEQARKRKEREGCKKIWENRWRKTCSKAKALPTPVPGS